MGTDKVVIPKFTASDLFAAVGQVPAKATWGEIVDAINEFVQSHAQVIPANCVLGEGMAEELRLLRELEKRTRAIKDNPTIREKTILDKLDTLRANQGGAAT